jgi:hypothetical protein
MSIKNAIVSDDDREFRKHKKTIADRQRDFVSLGQALGYVRIKKLYKIDGYATFEDFVEQQCEISRAHAYRVIEAARVVAILSPTGDKSRAGERVKNEAQARALIPLGRDRDAMLAVLDAAEKRGRITGAALAEVRVELYPHTRVLEGEFREGGLPEIEAPKDGPAPGDVAPALGQAIADTAASVGTGVASYAKRERPTVLCPVPRDLDRCNVCGAPLVERNAGYLRCKEHDGRQEHVAWPTDEGLWLECRICYPPSEDGSQNTAAVTAESPTEPAGTGLGGEPADADQAATSAGTPTGPTSPGPVGDQLEGGAHGRRLSDPEDSPAAELIEPSHAGVPAVGDQIEERIEEGIGCDRCDFSLLVSAVDPDASLTEMRYHLRSEHDLFGDAAGMALARVRTISPAAPLDTLPVGAPPASEQPGQDSPTGRDHAGAIEPEFAVATAGRSEIDHHQVSGVSPGGVPPEMPSVMAGELEDGGGTSLTPPSSGDALMFLTGQFALALGQLDAEALGPLIDEDDVPTLLRQADDFVDFVRRLIKARNP